VTFAFTDIEGSTQRWERNRAAMDDALQRHDAILRSTIGAHGGTVFKTIGDAFCAAFSRPSDAVAALVAAQRMLAAEDFTAVDGLRIRAALHTGAAEERDGDYFGPPVNRVARLLGVAHGGQIVLTGATYELAASVTGPDVTFRDLGRHRLKDLIEPEHVFQLVVPGLAAEFPALRSLEVLEHNLPQQMTALIGRERELEELGTLLGTHRLVTVVGAGGVGKTRTTLQVGANLLDTYTDGVWFVELAPLANVDYLPATIAQAMAVHLGAEGDPVDALVTALKQKHALLIFDNCEHVLDGAARVIGALLRGGPRLGIIASSRQALGIAGEATFHMPSLATAPPNAPPRTAAEALSWPAIALFAERAASADRRFALTDDNAATIADICRRLDGIPLAIELAAARVKILSPKQLHDRLDERFRVLTGGNRDAMPRQQTLYALIDWSHELLDDRERALFRRLGIFVNGFTLEGAVAVGTIDGLDELDVLDLLQSLVDKSLVATEPHGDEIRYRILESTRAYARDKLAAAGESERAANAHARYFRSVVAQAYSEFDSKMPPGWLERYASEIDDLRAALHHTLAGPGDGRIGANLAADSGPIFLRMEMLGEGLRWCEAARRIADVPQATMGRIDYVASMLHNNLGQSRPGLACAERAVTFYENSADERGLVRALSQVAQLYTRLGRPKEATSPAAEALLRARKLGEPRVLSSVLRRCASSLPTDEIDQARLHFTEALNIARSVHDREEESLVLVWWAGREAAAGSLARAIDLATEALMLTTGDGQIFLELHIARWELAQGRLDEAAPHARRALALSLNIESPQLRAYAIALCAPFQAEREPVEAAMAFGYATARLRELEFEPDTNDQLALATATLAIERKVMGESFASLLERGAARTEREVVSALTGSF
jgi:predicted ATPase